MRIFFSMLFFMPFFLLAQVCDLLYLSSHNQSFSIAQLDRRTGDVATVGQVSGLLEVSASFYHMDADRKELYLFGRSSSYGRGVHAINALNGNINWFYPFANTSARLVGYDPNELCITGLFYQNNTVHFFTEHISTNQRDTVAQVTGVTTLVNNAYYEVSNNALYVQGTINGDKGIIAADMKTGAFSFHPIGQVVPNANNYRYFPKLNSLVSLVYDEYYQNQHVAMFNLSTNSWNFSEPILGVKWISSFVSAIDTLNGDYLFSASAFPSPSCERLYSYNLLSNTVTSAVEPIGKKINFLFVPPPRLPVFSRDTNGNIDSSLFELECIITPESDSNFVIQNPCNLKTALIQESCPLGFKPVRAHAIVPTQAFAHLGDKLEWRLIDAAGNTQFLQVAPPFTSTGVYELTLELNCDDSTYIFSDMVIIDQLYQTNYSIVKKHTAFSAYPNPNQGVLSIVSDNIEQINIQVFDSKARLVASFPNQVSNTPIDISELRSGLYFLHIEGGFVGLEVHRLLKL